MSLYHHLRAQLFSPVHGQRTYHPQFRLEGRARNPNTEESLAMRIADPLWILGRQLQFGEFLGEDNASPVSVKINYRKRRLNQLGASEEELQPVDVDRYPFEYCIESIPQHELNLRQRVQAGQQLERLIRQHSPTEAKEIIDRLREQYALNEDSFAAIPDEDSRSFYQLMHGRVVDGQNFYNAHTTSEQVDEVLLNSWQQYVVWYRKQYNLQTEEQQKYWKDTQLLHRFVSKYESAEGEPEEELLLAANDYQSGQLDWYTFDDILNVKQSAEGAISMSEELQPVSLSFSTMPDKRLYTFEDNKVDLGSMKVDPSDLLRMMLINFSFLTSNDWFTLPLEMALGEVAWIENIEVSDAFGVKTIIKNGHNAAGEQIGPILDKNPLKVWDVFKIRSQPLPIYDAARDLLLLAPTLNRRQQSKPLEEVLLLRDEYANMVWGVEKTVQNVLGQPRNGFDQHRMVHGSPLERPSAEESLIDEDGNPLPVFHLSSTVPYNWIPYLPVHLTNSEQEIELWQAQLLHPNDARSINPLSQLITQDLSRLREEAVPRSGTRVQLVRQRVRWTDGSTHVWMGRSVTPGRGEGSSGLKFDELKEVEHED